jgi:hypothetical protein
MDIKEFLVPGEEICYSQEWDCYGTIERFYITQSRIVYTHGDVMFSDCYLHAVVGHDCNIKSAQIKIFSTGREMHVAVKGENAASIVKEISRQLALALQNGGYAAKVGV